MTAIFKDTTIQTFDVKYYIAKPHRRMHYVFFIPTWFRSLRSYNRHERLSYNYSWLCLPLSLLSNVRGYNRCADLLVLFIILLVASPNIEICVKIIDVDKFIMFLILLVASPGIKAGVAIVDVAKSKINEF